MTDDARSTPPPDLREALAALTDEDELAHGEAIRGGDTADPKSWDKMGRCAYDDEEWPCRTQRGIDKFLAHPAILAALAGSDLPGPINDHERSCPDCQRVIAEERRAALDRSGPVEGLRENPLADDFLRVAADNIEAARMMLAATPTASPTIPSWVARGFDAVEWPADRPTVETALVRAASPTAGGLDDIQRYSLIEAEPDETDAYMELDPDGEWVQWKEVRAALQSEATGERDG